METNKQKVFTISSIYDGVESMECSVLYQGKRVVGASAHVMMLCRGLLASSSAEMVVGYDGDGVEICRYKR